jgi:hypothetical protein
VIRVVAWLISLHREESGKTVLHRSSSGLATSIESFPIVLLLLLVVFQDRHPGFAIPACVCFQLCVSG